MKKISQTSIINNLTTIKAKTCGRMTRQATSLLVIILSLSLTTVTTEATDGQETPIYNGCRLTGLVGKDSSSSTSKNHVTKLDGSNFDLKKCFIETHIMKGTLDMNARNRGFGGPGEGFGGPGRGFGPGGEFAGGGIGEEQLTKPPSLLVELQLSKDRPPMQFQLQPLLDVNNAVKPKQCGNTGAGSTSFMGFHGKRMRKKMIGESGVVGGEAMSRTMGGGEATVDKLDLSEINMIANEQNGYLAGSAQMDGSIFHFETRTTADNSNGTTAVIVATETRLSDLPPDEPREVDLEELLKPASFSGERFLLRGGGSGAQKDEERFLSSSSSKDKTTYIDVLVPYTRRTLCVMNGASEKTTCNVTEERKETVFNRIMLAIEESNIALEASGIYGKKFRLVYSFLIEDTPDGWDETSISYNQVLSSTAKRDGFMDSILTQRDKYGADVVVTMVDHPESCGLAYGGSPVESGWAFAVVSWICATGYYSFGHEIAHLLGAKHDRMTEKCPKGCCKDDSHSTKGSTCENYGYIDPSNRYRSIMSYNCPVEGGCPRLQMFSTPDHLLEVNDVPMYTMGKKGESNNAEIISQNFDIVANYRQPPSSEEEEEEKEEEKEGESEGQGNTSTKPTETEVKPSTTTCGDGICRRRDGEDCHTCPEDCASGTHGGVRNSGTCGNSICERGETCLTCPQDCASRDLTSNPEYNFCCVGGPAHIATLVTNGLHCAAKLCQLGLQCDSSDGTGEPLTEYCCGDGVCSPGEGVWRDGDNGGGCPTDCHCVNNGICEFWEDKRCDDCQDANAAESDETKQNCLAHGRPCTGFSPNPCCGICLPINENHANSASICVPA